MNPLVSILIPAYNAEKYIANAIESALAQTWKNIEIIIVDDGSLDQTFFIAKRYQSSLVNVIRQKNKGASNARNVALNLSQGDFIQYLDADDVLAPDKIEKQLCLTDFNSNFQCLVSGEWARFYQVPSEALFIPQDLWMDKTPSDWLVEAWEKNLMMHPAAWLVSRYISDLAGLWNENLTLNDDGEYFCRAILASRGIVFCKGARSYYRSNVKGSLSSSNSLKAWESAFLSIQLSTNNLLLKEDSDRTRYASACYWQYFVFMVYPEAMELINKAEQKIDFLGGCDLSPDGGKLFMFISKFLSWKVAIRWRKLYYRYRYRK